MSGQAKGGTVAETVYFEIADAIDLLDNVTATDSTADDLGQAELALFRARDALAGDALGLFSEAPAMLAALRKAESFLAGFEGDTEVLDDPIDGDLHAIRAILARIDGPTAQPAGATGGAAEPAP